MFASSLGRPPVGYHPFIQKPAPLFSHATPPATENPADLLTKAIQRALAANPLPDGKKLSADKIAHAIQKNKPLPLPKPYFLHYGYVKPDGSIVTPSPEVKMLLESYFKQHPPKHALPVVVTANTPAIEKGFHHLITKQLQAEGKGFAHTYKTPSGVTNRNVILCDFIANLISGDKASMSPFVRKNILPAILGHDRPGNPLKEFYRITSPGLSAREVEQINRSGPVETVRMKLNGLELAKKVYSEGQEAEVASVLLSLAMGAIGEPVINHLFQEGGTTASIIRTGLMSMIDMMGNVLSVMGVVSEDLKAHGKKLTLKTARNEAAPDIKRGLRTGILGGMLGVLYNIPAGGIISMPSADMAARSVIGGIGCAGSAVAIPPIVRQSKLSFVKSIETLIEDGKIQLPPHIANHPHERKKYIERLAHQELNLRIGIATSVKATNLFPLIGTGSAILAAEKLGIPRHFVQTAYMSLAPVMPNALRLAFTVPEKLWTIPRRMNRLNALVYDSGSKPFTLEQRKKMDQAFLSTQSHLLNSWITSATSIMATGAILLTAEVAYFMVALKKDQRPQQLASQPAFPISSSPTLQSPLNYYPPRPPLTVPVGQLTFPTAIPGRISLYSPSSSAFPSNPWLNQPQTLLPVTASLPTNPIPIRYQQV